MNRRAFTLIDLAGCIVGATLVAATAIAFVADDPPQDDAETAQSRGLARQLKDATQIRGIAQGLIIFSQNNGDEYPLPSKLDKSSDTVKGEKFSKDTSANIMSILVYQNFLTPELLVSPVENNSNIEVDSKYSYTEPKTAVNPKKALWDPAFSADFTGPAKGHLSYAHMMPHGERMANAWTSSFMATTPVLCNRGPQMKTVTYNEENTSATMELATPTSNTLKFFDGAHPRTKDEPIVWRGNVAFQDNHIDFIVTKYGDKQTVTDKDVAKYNFAESRTRPDIAFFDEPDDAKEANTILGIFTGAGEKRADWKAIWD